MIFLGSAFQLYGDKEKVPNDIRWIRQSLEYERLCEQVYQRSTVQILKVLKKESKKQNLAVVVDLDVKVSNLRNSSLYRMGIKQNYALTEINNQEILRPRDQSRLFPVHPVRPRILCKSKTSLPPFHLVKAVIKDGLIEIHHHR